MRDLLAVFPAALAAGCVDTQSFDETVGKEVCGPLASCDPEGVAATCVGNAFAGHGSVQHCTTFHQERAPERLRGIRTADCEDAVLGDFEAECADVWSECEGLALAACLISAGLDSLTG